MQNLSQNREPKQTPQKKKNNTTIFAMNILQDAKHRISHEMKATILKQHRIMVVVSVFNRFRRCSIRLLTSALAATKTLSLWVASCQS
jgi:hypothetical protein